VPWCDDCAKFWNPSSMPADGTCPTCRRSLDAPHAKRERARDATTGSSSDGAEVEPVDPRTLNVRELAGEQAKAPWHFKLLVVAVVLYLLWRLVQLIGWIIH
jgi:hypothetical protein